MDNVGTQIYFEQESQLWDDHNHLRPGRFSISNPWWRNQWNSWRWLRNLLVNILELTDESV